MSKVSKGQHIGYIRVSTLDQNTDRQEELLAEHQLDKTFIDHASGKDVARPQLQAAMTHLREGDTLFVASIDRLARNLEDLRRIVRELTDRGVIVRFVKESLTFGEDDSPMSKLMLSMMGAFAEFERALIRERQREGIALAKERGAFKGRKPTLNAEKVAELVAKDKANGHKGRAGLARDFGISRETLYQYLRSDTTAKDTESL